MCKKKSTIFLFFFFQVPGVTLHGQVMWFPEQFLISHLSAVAKMMDKKLVQTLSSNRHNYLQAKAQSCQNDLKQYHHQVRSLVFSHHVVFFREINFTKKTFPWSFESILQLWYYILTSCTLHHFSVKWLGSKNGECIPKSTWSQFNAWAHWTSH